jgi:hypothetical protein
MTDIEQKIYFELRKYIDEFVVIENNYTYHLGVNYLNDTLSIFYTSKSTIILSMKYENCISFKEIDSCIHDYVKYFSTTDIKSSTFNNELINKFSKELEQLINRHSVDNALNTPDYILSNYLINCLETFDNTIKEIEKRKK